MNRMRGATLVVTVWLIALGTILALNFSQMTRGDTKITAAALTKHKARAAAEAGIWRAVYEIDAPHPEDPWPTNGSAIEFDFNGAEVLVIAQDLSGLADLNVASRETLAPIVDYITQDPLRSEQIVARILDWRDRDNVMLTFGAEDAEYRAAGSGYEAKDGPFSVREELQLIMGLSADEYRRLAPFVTVHSQKRTINLAAAPAHVLHALTNDDSREPEPANRHPDEVKDPARTTRASVRRGRGAFEILVQADLNGVLSRLAATVAFNQGRRNRPKIAILSWRETWPVEIPVEDINENPSAP